MSEFMLIMGQEKPAWPPYPATDNPEKILLHMLACLRDLDRIDARLAAAYLETAINHLRVQFNLNPDASKTE